MLCSQFVLIRHNVSNVPLRRADETGVCESQRNVARLTSESCGEHRSSHTVVFIAEMGLGMPIVQLAPRTLVEICEDITAFERRFNLSTADFIAMDSRLPEIDEDEAVEWLYLAEQRTALQETSARRPYLRCAVGKTLKNNQCSMDLLAA